MVEETDVQTLVIEPDSETSRDNEKQSAKRKKCGSGMEAAIPESSIEEKKRQKTRISSNFEIQNDQMAADMRCVVNRKLQQTNPDISPFLIPSELLALFEHTMGYPFNVKSVLNNDGGWLSTFLTTFVKPELVANVVKRMIAQEKFDVWKSRRDVIVQEGRGVLGVTALLNAANNTEDISTRIDPKFPVRIPLNSVGTVFIKCFTNNRPICIDAFLSALKKINPLLDFKGDKMDIVEREPQLNDLKSILQIRLALIGIMMPAVVQNRNRQRISMSLMELEHALRQRVPDFDGQLRNLGFTGAAHLLRSPAMHDVITIQKHSQTWPTFECTLDPFRDFHAFIKGKMAFLSSNRSSSMSSETFLNLHAARKSFSELFGYDLDPSHMGMRSFREMSHMIAGIGRFDEIRMGFVFACANGMCDALNGNAKGTNSFKKEFKIVDLNSPIGMQLHNPMPSNPMAAHNQHCPGMNNQSFDNPPMRNSSHILDPGLRGRSNNVRRRLWVTFEFSERENGASNDASNDVSKNTMTTKLLGNGKLLQPKMG